ncbi:MAG: SDR family NAD(P)-dependent oxidoreductase [Candidatus Thorarchaeota archaeon]
MPEIEKLCSLEGKVAIVTGAGRGVGHGIASVFARAGADVVVAEINLESARSTSDKVRSMGRRAISVNTDVTDPDSVEAMLKRALNEFGQVDVLVNNVGGVVGKPRMVPFLEMDLDYWDPMIRLNLTSSFICCRACIGYWVQNSRPGRIVNIASLAAMVPYKSSVAYAAAKAGVVSMTATLATLFGKNDIRVNCIAPGHVKTPITDELYKGREEVRAAQDRIIPLGRYGDPEEIGKVAAFLASDASSYVTGQTLVVSGGMYYFLTELP